VSASEGERPVLEAVYIAPEDRSELIEVVAGYPSQLSCHRIGYWGANFSPGLNVDARARRAGALLIQDLQVLDWKNASLGPPTAEEIAAGAPSVWINQRFALALDGPERAVYAELETVRSIRDATRRNTLRGRYGKELLPVPQSPLTILDQEHEAELWSSAYPPPVALRWMIRRCTALFLWEGSSESGLCCHVLDNNAGHAVTSFIAQCRSAGIPVVELDDPGRFPVT
jgi:hypothetical protein